MLLTHRKLLQSKAIAIDCVALPLVVAPHVARPYANTMLVVGTAPRLLCNSGASSPSCALLSTDGSCSICRGCSGPTGELTFEVGFWR